MGEDKRILQIGGLGGLLAGIVLIVGSVVFVSVGGAGTTEESLTRMNEFGAAYLAFPALSLVAFLLSLPLFLALYRGTKSAGPAPAMLGVVLGASGALVVAANWAMILIGLPVLSQVHATATDAERSMILFAAQAWEQITHAFQFFGGLLIGLAATSFGWGMLASHGGSRVYGWASAILGLLITASWVLAAGFSGTGIDVAFVGIGLLATIPLFLLLGWRVYSLSRSLPSA